ncbi:MAG: endonuclease III [Pseudomonadota bacterium]
MVKSMLGARTRGPVSLQAMVDLRRRFGDWDQVRVAPIWAIEETIRPVTFAADKALRLRDALAMIVAENHAMTLDNLAAMGVTEALTWLERLPGVGRKVSASVLNQTPLRKRALVIDTHHLRVLQRLGLVGHKASITQAYDIMMPLMPITWSAADLDEHHWLLKRFGQALCTYHQPSCSQCPCSDQCASLWQNQKSRRHQASA